jgi:hypothetical protein
MTQRILLLILVAELCLAAPPNTLSSAEKRAGWTLLFDGSSLNGWKWSLDPAPPTPSWEAVDGMLCATPGRGTPVYLLTRDSFGDFEFSFDFNIPEAGNSGVKYRFQGYSVLGKIMAQPGGPRRIEPLALEYQITDDLANRDALTSADRSTAALYGYFAPLKKTPVRPGLWHTGRIVARGLHLEHWLDGHKVLELDLDKPEVHQAFLKTGRRWSEELASQQTQQSPIALQLHDGPACFRNLKLRRF